MSELKFAFAKRLLDVIENDIIPLTKAGVANGNKVFGAAILRSDDLSLVVAGTNEETANPLFHGEISALNAFYRLPEDQRPPTSKCLFIATHEPCSLCLSAITWTGFDNFYYLFGYEDTRDAFAIPHDLKILKEVFKLENGDYARDNAFWHANAIQDLVDQGGEAETGALNGQIARISDAYADLSKTYQDAKSNTSIPLN